MKQLRYKRKWRAMEAIQDALKNGKLIAWYFVNGEIVVNVKKG